MLLSRANTETQQVVVVVVVVQTRCNDEMFIHDAARDAPDYGGHVPVDTTPGPVPVYRALKSNPISSSPP